MSDHAALWLPARREVLAQGRAPDVAPRSGGIGRDRPYAGAIAIGKGSAATCMDVVAACQGRRVVAQVTPPPSFDDVPAGRRRMGKLAPVLARMAFGDLASRMEARRLGIATNKVWDGSLIGNEVGPPIYEALLPQALARGCHAAPEPLLVGHGLGCVPDALELQRVGVSARKLVVTL